MTAIHLLFTEDVEQSVYMYNKLGNPLKIFNPNRIYVPVIQSEQKNRVRCLRGASSAG